MKNTWTPKIKLNATGVAVMQSRPGMYRLVYIHPETKRCRIFYAAKTENLRKEIADHLPWREKNVELSYYLNNFKCFFQVSEFEQEAVSITTTRSKTFLQRFFNIFPTGENVGVSYK